MECALSLPKTSSPPWVRALMIALLVFALIVIGLHWLPPLRTVGSSGAFAPPVIHMNLEGITLDEISGLCFSRMHPGHIWVHQDDINDPRLYRFDASGNHQQTVLINGVLPEDWEDIALGPLPDGSDFGIFIGDIGDREENEPDFQVVVIDERDTLTSNQVAPVRIVDALWPGGMGRNCEGLMVSQISGDIFLMTRSSNGLSRMFRVPFADWTAEGGESPTAIFVGLFQLSQLGTETGLLDDCEVTAADFDPGMRTLALRTKHFVYLYALSGDPTAALFSTTPFAMLSTAVEPQGEAVTFGLDGRDVFTASEGSDLILRFARNDPPNDGVTLH
ncbi:hypothetical protein JXA47_10420 [Candidatus Sumerlaeota bacterium]|nr:hypothetical protein [Candidatus Sumerlaeota bacterium]